MKISTQWMSEILGQPVMASDVAEKLTMAGLEVESIESVAPFFSGVVVGHVLERRQHPDADRLSVCRVDLGEHQSVQIVCGAQNVRPGLKVAVVKVGGVLPGDFKIKKAKLRGVESEGMICSSNELGLKDLSEGILELPADAPIGEDFREYYQLNDEVIDLSITPNRGDCLSMHGVARELSALSGQLWQAPEIQSVKPTIDDWRGVTVIAKTACPRYTGRLVVGLNADARTPFWMMERLRRAGQRATGLAVVDSINTVMLEMGQPMHAFDADKLSGDLVIREAKAFEKLVVLSGDSVELAEGSLLVTDDSSILAIAGVMGAAGSAVTETTTRIFLESAFFSDQAIGQSSQQNGVRSESSYRYERGVDFNLPIKALERVTQLIIELCGGQAGPVVEALAPLPKRDPIILTEQAIRRFLDVPLSGTKIEGFLKALGFYVRCIDEHRWSVSAPSYRFDIEQPVDLVEEVIRLYGYDRVPYQPLVGELTMPIDAGLGLEDYWMLAKAVLVERAYCEALTYSFVDPVVEALLTIEHGEPIPLLNPLAKEMSVMRRSLWPGLLQSVLYNLNRQQTRVRLFEQGRCFFFDDVTNKVREDNHLAGVIVGSLYEKQWAETDRSVDFYDLKQDVTQLANAMGWTLEWATSEHKALHPYQQQAIRIGAEAVGFLGALHPELVQKLGLSQTPFLFELKCGPRAQALHPQFEPFSRFPSMKRDLSFVAEERIKASEICDRVCKLAGPLLNKVEIFDIYRSAKVGEGRKSVSLGLVFQDPSRTLTDEEIDNVIQQVVHGLSNELGAQLRD
jgi:phenylalanyl-tRNA synthetase beta chain